VNQIKSLGGGTYQFGPVYSKPPERSKEAMDKLVEAEQKRIERYKLRKEGEECL